MIQETCSCGASVIYPDHLGIEPAEKWRTSHAHKAKEEKEPEKQGAGFAATQVRYDHREPELLAGKDKW